MMVAASSVKERETWISALNQCVVNDAGVLFFYDDDYYFFFFLNTYE